MQLEQRKNKVVQVIKDTVAKNKESALDYICNLVLDVDVSMSNEQKVHIERQVLQAELKDKEKRDKEQKKNKSNRVDLLDGDF